LEERRIESQMLRFCRFILDHDLARNLRSLQLGLSDWPATDLNSEVMTLLRTVLRKASALNNITITIRDLHPFIIDPPLWHDVHRHISWHLTVEGDDVTLVPDLRSAQISLRSLRIRTASCVIGGLDLSRCLSSSVHTLTLLTLSLGPSDTGALSRFCESEGAIFYSVTKLATDQLLTGAQLNTFFPNVTHLRILARSIELDSATSPFRALKSIQGVHGIVVPFLRHHAALEEVVILNYIMSDERIATVLDAISSCEIRVLMLSVMLKVPLASDYGIAANAFFAKLAASAPCLTTLRLSLFFFKDITEVQAWIHGTANVCHCV
jgi:hypothetical protein